MNDDSLEKRKLELKLFDQIMRWEHDNKYSKEYSDRQMQDRIKKLIQTQVAQQN